MCCGVFEQPLPESVVFLSGGGRHGRVTIRVLSAPPSAPHLCSGILVLEINNITKRVSAWCNEYAYVELLEWYRAQTLCEVRACRKWAPGRKNMCLINSSSCKIFRGRSRNQRNARHPALRVAKNRQTAKMALSKCRMLAASCNVPEL